MKNEQFELTKFHFNQEKIGVIMIDGEPWFIGQDIAGALNYKNTSDALAKHVEKEDKKVIPFLFENAGNPNRIIINEPGLYSLIFASTLPIAKTFKHWVTHEVLPSLRKTGSYSLTNAPEAELLRELQRTNQKLDILIKQNEQKKARKQLPKEPLLDDEKAMIISAICDLAQKNQRVKAYYPEFRKYLVSKFGRDVLPVHAKKYLEALAPELKEKGIILQGIGENFRIPNTKEQRRGFIICG